MSAVGGIIGILLGAVHHLDRLLSAHRPARHAFDHVGADRLRRLLRDRADFRHLSRLESRQPRPHRSAALRVRQRIHSREGKVDVVPSLKSGFCRPVQIVFRSVLDLGAPGQSVLKRGLAMSVTRNWYLARIFSARSRSSPERSIRFLPPMDRSSIQCRPKSLATTEHA